jgi:hypothetical protein
MPHFQSFTRKSTREVYCSRNQYASHADASAWVADALRHFNIQASDTKNYRELNNQPAGATIWPD